MKLYTIDEVAEFISGIQSDNILKLYTVEEVARILKITRVTLYNYIKTNKLQASKIGRTYRIKEADLMNFLKDYRKISMQAN